MAVAVGSGEEVALADLERGVLGQFDASEKEQIRNEIQRVSRGRALEDTATIADQIAGGAIKTPKEVEAFPSRHLRPADREALAADLMKRQSAAEKFRLSDSETQFTIMGNLLVRAERWNKEAPEADREYFEIQRQALQLPEGLRGDITTLLKEKRADSITPDDTLTDYTRNHLTRLFDRGLMGKFKVPGVGLNPQTGLKNPDTIDPVIQDEAHRVLAKTQAAMSRWLKSHPRADELETEKHMAEILVRRMAPGTVAAVLQEGPAENPLIPQLPGAGTAPDTVEAAALRAVAGREELRRHRAEAAGKAVLDGVDAVLTPGQKADRAALYGMTGDNGAAAKRQMAHIMFLATETGRPASEISEHYEDWKALYARAHFDGGTDEGNFGAKVKEVVTQRRDFRIPTVGP